MPRTKQQKPRHYVVDEEITEGVTSLTSSPSTSVDINTRGEEIQEPLNKCDTPQSEEAEQLAENKRTGETGETTLSEDVVPSKHAFGHLHENDDIQSKRFQEPPCTYSNSHSLDEHAAIDTPTDLRKANASWYATDQFEQHVNYEDSLSGTKANMRADSLSVPREELSSLFWDHSRNAVYHDEQRINKSGHSSNSSDKNNATSVKDLGSDRYRELLTLASTRNAFSGVDCSDRLQYQALSSAAAQYVEAIKRFYDGVVPKAPSGDFWSAWSNVARRSAFADLATKEQEQLFYSYLTQLSERWNSMMARQFGKGGERYERKPNVFTSNTTLEPQCETPNFQGYSHTSEGKFPDISPRPYDLTPAFQQQTHAPRPAHAITVSTSSLPTKMCIDLRENEKPASASVPSQLVNNKITTRSSPSPNKASPITSRFCDKAASLHSPVSDNSYLEKQLQSKKTLHRWNDLTWSGNYSVSQSHPIPDLLHRHSSMPSAKKSSSLKSGDNCDKADCRPNRNEGRSAARFLTNSGFSPSERVDARSSVSPLEKASLLHQDSGSPTSRTPTQAFTHQSCDSRYISELQAQHNLYTGFAAPGWLNSSQSAGGLLTSAMVPSYPNSGGSSVLLHNRSPLFLDRFQPGSPSSYLLDPTDTSPGAKSVASRRIRSRGSPINSVHAAIVREAKEQFKGLDPENMYIQCPICQKRIKRLYHFQRHMRIHTGEKTHHCPCCQYKSVRKDNLKSHMKTHEKQNLEHGRRPGRTTYQSVRDNSDCDRNRSETRSVPAPAAKPTAHRSRPSLPASAKLGGSGATSWIEQSDYKASFAYSPQYPFPYFSRQYTPYMDFSQLPGNSTSVNVDSSGRNASPGFHQNSNSFSPLSTTNKLLINQMSSEDQENTVAASSPAVLSDSNLDAEEEHHGLKRREEDSRMQWVLHKSTDKPSSPKRMKLNDSRFPSSTEHGAESRDCNANQNNSNVTNGSLTLTSCYSADRDSDAAVPTVELESPSAQTTCGVQDSVPVSTNKARLHLAKSSGELEESNLPNIRFASTASTALAEMAAAAAASRSDVMALSETEPDGNEKDADKRVHRTSSSSSSSSSISSPTAPNDVTTGHRGQGENTQLVRFSSVVTPVSESLHTLPSPYSINGILNAGRLLRETSKLQLPHSGSIFSAQGRTETSMPSSNPCNDADDNEQLAADKNKLSPDSSPIPAKELACRLCSFRSTSSGDMQSHMSLAHKQDGFYKCDECNYLGKNLSKLVEHIRIHTGERPFKCDQCNYAAKRKDNLAQHKAVRHDKRKNKPNFGVNEPSQVNGTKNSTTNGKVPFFGAEEDSKENPFPISNFHGSTKTNATVNGVSVPGMDGIFSNLAMTPFFHSFPAVQSLSAFHYPLFPPSPLLHPQSGLDPLTGGHARGVGERPTNPGNYSLKVRAALISP